MYRSSFSAHARVGKVRSMIRLPFAACGPPSLKPLAAGPS